ncbi:hypothetical protein SESBI_43796 [Sesbania bispinosa]|nr:hypothetical protein SESBI_43796 [Sesbania bispinosa]
MALKGPCRHPPYNLIDNTAINQQAIVKVVDKKVLTSSYTCNKLACGELYNRLDWCFMSLPRLYTLPIPPPSQGTV